MDNRSINEMILRCEGVNGTTNDVSISGSAERGVMLIEEHEDDEDDWISLDNPGDISGDQVLMPNSSPALSDGEMVMVESHRELGGENGDVDVLAEIRAFLWMLLHHISQNNPRLMLAALLQCFSIYLYIRAHVYSMILLVTVFVYNLPTILGFVDALIERKQLNRLTFVLILAYHFLQIQSIGYMLHYLNCIPNPVQLCTYSIMICFLFIAHRNHPEDLRLLYPHANIFLYIVTLVLYHTYPIETVNRTLIEANFLQFISVTVIRGNLDIFENVKKTMKTYTMRKLDKLTQYPENSVTLFTFVLDFLLSDNKNAQNEEFSLTQELRKINSSGLNEEYKNYEKIVRNIEVTSAYSYLYFVRNSLTILAFLDGRFFINIGAVVLILLETITLLSEPMLYDEKHRHHLFFGSLSNLATLHDRLLTSLTIYQGVVVSVTGYQATMAVYDTFIAFKNVWNTINAVPNR